MYDCLHCVTVSNAWLSPVYECLQCMISPVYDCLQCMIVSSVWLPPMYDFSSVWLSPMHDCLQCMNVSNVWLPPMYDFSSVWLSPMHDCLQCITVSNAWLYPAYKCLQRMIISGVCVSPVPYIFLSPTSESSSHWFTAFKCLLSNSSAVHAEISSSTSTISALIILYKKFLLSRPFRIGTWALALVWCECNIATLEPTGCWWGNLREIDHCGRRRRRWEDNIKINLQDVRREGIDWIDLARVRDRWRAL
jgi:hypothetical protein